MFQSASNRNSPSALRLQSLDGGRASSLYTSPLFPVRKTVASLTNTTISGTHPNNRNTFTSFGPTDEKFQQQQQGAVLEQTNTRHMSSHCCSCRPADSTDSRGGRRLYKLENALASVQRLDGKQQQLLCLSQSIIKRF